MRKAGVLMPIPSLSSPWGVGTLGKAALDFADFLQSAGQSCWQVLPIGPTGYGDSPYQPFSSFAGNPYLIDLDGLSQEGLLEPEEYQQLFWGKDPGKTDYGLLYQKRFAVLEKAVKRLKIKKFSELRAFCEKEAEWLEDYALFMALKGKFAGSAWNQWPEPFKRREAKALALAKKELEEALWFWKGVQFLFFHQWEILKRNTRERGISIIGDLPIYVAEDSADVWAHPEQFQMDENLHPRKVAGCPPDGFSATGQLWGNPLFDWQRMKQEGYGWWIHRISFQLRLYDILRIDHFRGFESYYAIPWGDKDASRGTWEKGPGKDFFEALEKTAGKQRIIAEDLGFITPEVKSLLEYTGFPGMKVLEFGFDRRDGGGRMYQPHNYPQNCVAYVGTHDNETALGWLEQADPEDVALAREYLRLEPGKEENWGMMTALWASRAELVIVQMQDLLGLGREGRMNIPSTQGENWRWRALPGDWDEALAKRLYRKMELYERLP